ncbi:hypothetical protein QJU89_00105 [Pasteurella skyensis]|uniref:Uncharacterized protein n=1 Tax=Phocoenobacter skyensis TaxID=97481 RepID=A0AAJ6N891_9PAST|nr:hypothetical protein [Pasteurella skyensis]MDP8161873.1 hypothetical protein [Pasteurella skyensis]MDP8172029.1 hypothetical protein [Pasteurella skyensis]MDP8176264.1 hypothetical protein [Pasteurella skyensis]MDP8178284.1 hypothetical protein [Pasteurella skyensis]MDP8182108.1 hypothetical protein [Pasteurella skyensis]
MTDKKYDEFYYCVDNTVYPCSCYWDLYEKDSQEATRIYESKMYCPICKQAPIIVAKGKIRKYMRVKNVDAHHSDCIYFLEEASKKETQIYYDDLDKSDISNKLKYLLNKMLKSQLAGKNISTKVSNPSSNRENIDITITTNNYKKKKYLPHISLYSRNIRENLNIVKMYYGKVKIYCKKWENGGISIYILTLNNKQICAISANKNVYKHLDIIFPEKKENAETYYVTFACEMYEKGAYLNGILIDSRMAIFEKVKD